MEQHCSQAVAFLTMLETALNVGDGTLLLVVAGCYIWKKKKIIQAAQV